MPEVAGDPNETTHLLGDGPTGRRHTVFGDEVFAALNATESKDETLLGESTVGDRLPYNDYTTIDWLYDLVKDSYRYRFIRSGKGLRRKLYVLFDACSGWIAAAIIGSLTACVAFLVDICEATVSDWKEGYCKRNPFMDKAGCCKDQTPLVTISAATDECAAWQPWSQDWGHSFGIYIGFALAFGLISATVTTFSRRSLPVAAPGQGDKQLNTVSGVQEAPKGKTIAMAAGSGIPEIKTILSGFVIPGYLDFKVLIIKAVGAVFAVATGMCLGKEGPFVHISGCVGYLVAMRFPKFRKNGRKMRELLSAAVAAGLSVAFGAPIGGVLFSYEEISTYFPRKVLWRAFLCSLFAAAILKELNPNGTGKLVLFETNYGTQYYAYHYLIFAMLGVVGGLWGGLFCRFNYLWSRWFRKFAIIKNNPIFEVFLVTLATVLLQYPNPLTREPGDKMIKNLLVDCNDEGKSITSFVCQNEAHGSVNGGYIGWLIMGCLVKLVLTTITFGTKVPSGVIIPALDAGCLFGRLVGQGIGTISPGIFAMVGASAFLAGVSRMTISLCVIMFELTGELEYVVPHMIGILIAKWVADALSAESVYDLAQNVLGHPFLDIDRSMTLVQAQAPAHLVGRLIPPKQTMDEITVRVDANNEVPRRVLEHKLDRLKERGLLDAGLVLIQGDNLLQGYIAEGELEFGLRRLGETFAEHTRVRLLGDFVDTTTGRHAGTEDTENHAATNGSIKVEPLDLSAFVDRTPLTLSESSPMEYAVELFAKLGLRHLVVTEEGTGRMIGVIIKKRLVHYLESLQNE